LRGEEGKKERDTTEDEKLECGGGSSFNLRGEKGREVKLAKRGKSRESKKRHSEP